MSGTGKRTPRVLWLVAFLAIIGAAGYLATQHYNVQPFTANAGQTQATTSTTAQKLMAILSSEGDTMSPAEIQMVRATLDSLEAAHNATKAKQRKRTATVQEADTADAPEVAQQPAEQSVPKEERAATPPALRHKGQERIVNGVEELGEVNKIVWKDGVGMRFLRINIYRGDTMSGLYNLHKKHTVDASVYGLEGRSPFLNFLDYTASMTENEDTLAKVLEEGDWRKLPAGKKIWLPIEQLTKTDVAQLRKDLVPDTDDQIKNLPETVHFADNASAPEMQQSLYKLRC